MTRPLPCSPERLAEVAREYRVTVQQLKDAWSNPSWLGDDTQNLPPTIEVAALNAYRERKAIEGVVHDMAVRKHERVQALSREFGVSVNAIWREKRDGDWPDDRSAAEALRARKEARRAARPWWLRWWPL